MSWSGYWLRRGLSILSLTFVFASVTFVVGQAGPPAGKDNNVSLTGTTWKLVEVYGKPVTHSAFDYYLGLAHGPLGRGSVNVEDGPNQETGTYEIDGDALHIRLHTSTLVAVRVPPRDQQPSFVKALKGTSRFKVQGSTLELLDADGGVLARLEAPEQS